MRQGPRGRDWGLTLLKLYFSPLGRIRPSLYWAALAALGLVGLGVNGLYGLLPNRTASYAALVFHSPGPGAGLTCAAEGCTPWGTPAGGAVLAIFVVAAFCVQAKRLHDANRSAGWLIGFMLLQFGFPAASAFMLSKLYKPDDFHGFKLYLQLNLVVGMLLPLLFKLWIGIARSRPEPNAHGPQPAGPFALTLPARLAGKAA